MVFLVQIFNLNMSSAEDMRPEANYLTLFLLIMVLLAMPCQGQESSSPGMQIPGEYAAFDGMTVKIIHVEFKECPWCTNTIENLARDLISLRVGEPFFEKQYRQSIEALMLSKRFEAVIPGIERTEDGIKVTFLLTPLREIKDIHIHGEYPLFKNDVLKSMNVYPGDALLPDSPALQEKLIGDLYKKEGYINPHVSVKAEQDMAGGSVILDVSIKPGPYYFLDSLKIRGNHAIFETEIKSRMNSWRTSFFIRESGRFIEKEFSQDIKDLSGLYWQRGYPECEIKESVSKNEATGEVKAAINITEGPYYELSFSGNKHFWSYTLKDSIPIFIKGNKRDNGIKNGIKEIKKRYQEDGFLFTEIEILEEKVTIKDEKERKIDLFIKEGPRTLVESIRFSGNSYFSEEELINRIQTGKAPFYSQKIFNPDILDEDLASIRALYLNHGYNEVSVSHELAWNKDKTDVSVLIKITEGVRTLVSSVKILGLKRIPERKALDVLQLKEGKPFRSDLIKSDETALSGLISGNGYPYVKVKSEIVMSKDDTEAAITYSVDEGQHMTMGNIYYRGNFKTRTSVITRELGIEPGQPFSLKTMLEGQKNIRNMEAFDSVQFKTFGIKEEQERVTLLIDMEEIEPYYVQAATGYASDRGLYGNTRIGDRNLFGLNKDAWIGGELSQIGYQGALSVTQQRIFDTPITNTNALSYEKKAEFNQIFGTSVWTSSCNFQRVYKPHTTTSLGFRYEWRDQFLKDKSVAIPVGDEDSYMPRGSLITTPFISYDTRDSFVRPQRGFYSSYAVDISKGYQNSLDNFLKHYLNLRYYVSPSHRLTLAWLGRLGYIYTYGKKGQLPEDQLFYLGGTMDVRGYDENMLRYDAGRNPVGGRLSLVGSMEARIEVSHDWETALFYDTGSVRRALVDAGSDIFRSSVGIGLRYVTPIGPMGLLYGYKLNRKEGESPGKFHFSIGYTF
jgi:outer membrane protein insertion porin family